MLKKLKYRIKKTFHFSNSESNGLLALIVLIFLLMMAPKLCMLYYKFSTKPLEHRADIALLEENLIALQANASKVEPININTATVQQLTAISGVAQKLAIRIIHYRDKLGGFVSLDQYKEVYGLSNRLQIRLQQQTVILGKYTPKQLSLNHATFKELVTHPYISPAMAKAMVDYRSRKGKFTTLRAMEALSGYHPDWAKKVIPYLSL